MCMELLLSDFNNIKIIIIITIVILVFQQLIILLCLKATDH